MRQLLPRFLGGEKLDTVASDIAQGLLATAEYEYTTRLLREG